MRENPKIVEYALTDLFHNTEGTNILQVCRRTDLKLLSCTYNPRASENDPEDDKAILGAKC